MQKHLVQLQYKTDTGKVKLHSRVVMAEGNVKAWAKVSREHQLHMGRVLGDRYQEWEIIGGYVTADPYKIDKWKDTETV
jgi:hypothetical protein